MNVIGFFIAAVSFFLPFSALANEQPVRAATKYELNVSLDVQNSKISGNAKIHTTAGKGINLYTGSLKIIEVKVDGKIVSNSPDPSNGAVKIPPSSDGSIEVRYEGWFKGSTSNSDKNAGVTESVIDERGISLTGMWYPRTDTLSKYNLTVVVPEGYEAVSEADRISKTSANGFSTFVFDFQYPVDGISLAASNKFDLIEDSFQDIGIYAYFFREDTDLAKNYIEYAKKYLKQYETLLGKYPYRRFAIVENFLPTGYSMPTYTLLGQDVVKLPFIVETSLGHEILHQWFGNSVYADYGKGNWAEGLTTYLADHLYKEQKGTGWEYRKQILIDYVSYVNKKNEFPLKDFRGRSDFASKSIGYGKTAMVFHMLKGISGEEAFYKALKDFVEEKRFKRVSWDDLKKSFENSSKKDLTEFFKQWLEGTDMPEIRLEGVKVRHDNGKAHVVMDMFLSGAVYPMDIPVSFYVNGEKIKELFKVDNGKYILTKQLEASPESIVIDEDYDLFRRLAKEETPPVIAKIIGEEKLLLVLPAEGKEAYRPVIEGFKERGAIEKEAADVKQKDIKASSVVILGNDNSLVRSLYAASETIEAGFSIIVKENPWDPGKVIGIINVRSEKEADAAFRKIFHYGKYNSLAFDNGRNILKKINETRRGIKMDMKHEPLVVDMSALKTLDDLIENVKAKKIVYVGEFHDRFAHHDVQLRVIKGLYKNNKKIAIGMEMFQRPFQGAIDDYLSGKIEEKEFFKKSEYFKRWGMDYNLYKPILDFAKSEKLPVVALNMKKEITEKTSKTGIDSLSDEEKKELPVQLDFSDSAYRERLKDVFTRHGNSQMKNFDYFYQAQVLWDETMSQSLDEFFKNNKDYQESGQMVILAGGGHFAFGSGIPQRAFRRNGYDYSIILNEGDVEKGIADYLVFTKPIEGVTALKIMTLLKDIDGKVMVMGFAEDSVAEKAGLKKGDRIIAVDNTPVTGSDDLRINLFYKKTGESVKIKLLRKRFLFGDREMEIDVKL